MTTIAIGFHTVRRITIGSDLSAALLKQRGMLPAPTLGRGAVRSDIVQQYRRILTALPAAGEFVDAAERKLSNQGGDGYMVLNCRQLLDHCELDDALTLITALLSLVATPFRAFNRWGLWKPLGTNLAAESMRATGVGYNPLHIDLVNATLPPDYSVLLCVRPDPQGGGYSLVANLRRALRRLNSEELELLRTPAFVDGTFYDLTGVGDEYNPFPIVDDLPPAEGFIRFTAKMLAQRDPDDRYTRAAQALEKELVAGQHRFLLDRGDVLVVDQHVACHGREALGSGQTSLAADERRLLMQTFLASEPLQRGS